ncbi:MAG: nitric oxide dioxygenase, partial [Staphylococcus epidermidis]|nr:nitric oxide dioxygenase [Staphylococcus epidermidis]
AQLHLHVKDKEGYLEAKELEQYLSEQPEIYICGGTNFLHSIINSLKELNYDMNHVHFETFIPRLSVQV